jgi:diaminohydroxyphosphoribosylaminopyrimidine deaminase/5-amino-6-(5-phosphoribosylamino)uracil reductase
LQTFIDENLWDEARVFKGSIAFGNGIKAPHLEAKLVSKNSILNDELLIFKNHD